MRPAKRHSVFIEGKGLQLYVFCDKYREKHMRRKHPTGAFEIKFDEMQGTCDFRRHGPFFYDLCPLGQLQEEPRVESLRASVYLAC